MMYTEGAETVAVSRGTSHVTTKQHCKCTTWVDIKKSALSKVSHTLRIPCAVSMLNSGEQRYIKTINNDNHLSFHYFRRDIAFGIHWALNI